MGRNLSLVAARRHAGLSQDELAQRIQEAGHQLGVPNECNRANVCRWEAGGQPQARYLPLLEDVLSVTADALGFGGGRAGAVLSPVPHAFAADVLAGPWVTCYAYAHGAKQLHHADIAHVTAESDRHIRAVNHPPEPRTEGRAVPFRNEIEAQLVGRHLIGAWRNTSDARYFGSLHLAVLPGETVMDGYYTGLASAIAVSVERWKWVRLDPAADLAGVTLAGPSALYDRVMGHSQYDEPLTVTGIGEGTT